MGPRSRVVSVRLTSLEFAAWTAAAGRSPFGTTAGWCRDAVAHAVEAYPVGSRIWASARIQEVPGEVVDAVRGACAGLNSAAMRSNRLGALVPEARPVLVAVVEASRKVPRIDTATQLAAPGSARIIHHYIERAEPRPHLVNLRVSAAEFDAWTSQARMDGYARVSGWVRAVVGALLGLRLPVEPVDVPGEYLELRRQLGGAITNLAQLESVAERANDAPAVMVGIEDALARIQTVLSGLYGPQKALVR